jgi:hypothetical protein
VPQKLQCFALHLWLREAKVQVGEDVARRLEHGLILLALRGFTKVDGTFNLCDISLP